MKKKIAFIAAVILSLSIVGCGSNESSEETVETTMESSEVTVEEKSTEAVTEAEPVDVSGTYNNVSLFFNSTYLLNENGTYDKSSPEEKGTYTVEDGKIVFTKKDAGWSETFVPLDIYYYRSDDHYFDEDKEYGAAPAFDENGRTAQSFATPSRKQDNGEYISNHLTMNEDGTFVLQNEVGRMQGGMLMVSDGDKYEGEYILNDEILTLKCNDIEYQFVFANDKIYYDVIVKQTEENEQEMESREAALQAIQDEKYAPIEEDLANEISEKLKGQWTFTGEPYTVTFEGYDVSVEAMGFANQGTYIVCKDTLLITYENGKKATMDYLYENGELKLAAPVALDE